MLLYMKLFLTGPILVAKYLPDILSKTFPQVVRTHQGHSSVAIIDDLEL